MRLRLTPARSRVLAVVLLGAVFALAYFGMAAPAINAITSRWDTASVLGRQRDATQSLASTAKDRVKDLAELRQSPTMQMAAYRASSPALAGAQLQGTLLQIVQSVGGSINAAQILTDTTLKGAAQVTVALNVTAPIAAQTQLLREIEAARPVLRVVKYSIRDPDGEWAAAPQSQGPNALQAELSVSAFLIVE